MPVITVCKNQIAKNNKNGWPGEPAIRVGKTAKSAATMHCHDLAIMDKHGEVVAIIRTTENGEPLVKCGAKVAIFTMHGVEPIR